MQRECQRYPFDFAWGACRQGHSMSLVADTLVGDLVY